MSDYDDYYPYKKTNATEKSGIKANYTDKNERTALHYAARAHENKKTVMALLQYDFKKKLRHSNPAQIMTRDKKWYDTTVYCFSM